MLEERFEHHKGVRGSCPTCGQLTHLAKRRGDGRWFWVHDRVLKPRSIEHHRLMRHDGEVSELAASKLMGGAACTQTQ